MPVTPSVHQMCAHSWQLFEMSFPNPIAIYSEQSQESWNKYVSKFKSGTGSRARQHSVKYNIQDTFARMLHMSHPAVVSKKRKIVCSVCGEIGHGARSKVHHGASGGAIGMADEELMLLESMYLSNES